MPRYLNLVANRAATGDALHQLEHLDHIANTKLGLAMVPGAFEDGWAMRAELPQIQGERSRLLPVGHVACSKLAS